MSVTNNPENTAITKPSGSSLRNRALGLLARREHSRYELRKKLTQKLAEECEPSDIDEVLDRLVEQGLLSDERFTEAYVNMRARKGYGPDRILMELNEKGIGSDLAQSYVCSRDDWGLMLAREWRKKFKSKPADYAEKMRQMRFLQYRGYGAEAIRRLLDSL